MSNKIDLTWLKTLIENYKNNITLEYETNSVKRLEYYYKLKAADEILEEIKTFIKEANTLTKE